MSLQKRLVAIWVLNLVAITVWYFNWRVSVGLLCATWSIQISLPDVEIFRWARPLRRAGAYILIAAFFSEHYAPKLQGVVFVAWMVWNLAEMFVWQIQLFRDAQGKTGTP
jgi:hypothetical protein